MTRLTHSVPSLLFSGAAAAALALFGSPAMAQNPLITGKSITLPPLGATANVGSLPMNMILTPDGKYAVTSDMGFHQLLSVLNASTGQVVSSIEFGSPSARVNPGLYFGLAVRSSPGGSYTLYASQGNNHTIGVLSISASGQLSPAGTIPMQSSDFPAGIALDSRGYLYVAVNQAYTNSFADASTPGSLVVYNTAASGVVSATLPTVRNVPAAPAAAETSRFSFGPTPAAANPAGSTPNYPYAVAALSGGGKIYVSSQRDDAVFVFNMTNPVSPALTKTITSGASSATQAHPVSLLLNRAQTKLFIAYAGGDSVASVDTSSDAMTSQLSLRPPGAATLPGVTPTGMSLTQDESRMYVSLSDMNAVGVVDMASGQMIGYIPAGWYPSAVIASPVKPVLLVANAKGTGTRNPNPSFVYSQGNKDPNYGLYLTVGNVETIRVPGSSQLSADTQMTLANNRITLTTATPANPLAAIGLNAGKIKHIVYIVKENRTYDQVLGDIQSVNGQAANGDAALTIFGASVTPNQHTLATRFVLLDNFFDCGEASGDGWPWSTQGQANEAVIKDLPYNYSGRGRNYDFEGSNNNYPTGGFPATDPYGNPLVGKDSPFFGVAAPAIADVSEAPGGHLWDVAKKSGRSYRNYGFFTSFGVGPAADLLLPSNLPGSAGLQPVGIIPTSVSGAAADLSRAGVSDFDMRGYDQNFADSEAGYFTAYGAFPAIPSGGTSYPVQSDLSSPALFNIPTFGHYNAPSRVSEFKRELAEMLKADPTGGAVPNLIMLKYSNDHTQGYSVSATNPKIHSPRSGVADNDYAVGQTVDLISHTPALWNSTAIFVIEDDAQDGPDHVDSHRSTCFVISPYIKANSVDHTFYNTDSVLKTMELLLSIPPMNQYDATANTILDFDTTPSNGGTYTALLPDSALLKELNPSMMLLRPGTAAYHLAKLSNAMDFVHPDSAPSGVLNQIIWKSVKGIHSQMPAPRHNAAIDVRLHLAKPNNKSAKRGSDD